MKQTRLLSAVCALFISVCLSVTANAATIFFDDFDGGQTLGSGVSGGFSGITTTTVVQGYVGLGTGGNVFSGNFLYNDSGGTPTIPGNTLPSATVLTLTELPAHSSINIDFLLAIIDTWDGEGGTVDVQPDFLNVIVDGATIFNHSFLNATTDTGITQSYIDPGGVTLADNQNLGFRDINNNDLDDAYNMGLDGTFIAIPHTASTLTIEWIASGDGWQGGLGIDEAWAIENVQISTMIPIPAAVWLFGSGLLGLVGIARRKKAA